MAEEHTWHTIPPLKGSGNNKAYQATARDTQRTSHESSAAWQNLLQATLADKLKLLMAIFSSTRPSANVSAPLAMAPTKTQMLSFGPSVST
ncbi:hypothetical protein HYQ46_002927 [Verticillium longisporum]|nr:hypothetical protein HYQ46_002927 [Verticillium longisporum]